MRWDSELYHCTLDLNPYLAPISTRIEKMKEFVEYIVKNLVDNPDKVVIKEIGGTQTIILELSVEKSDIGKIIGKRGKTINAIRTLLMSVASRNGIRVNLEIMEDDAEEGATPAAAEQE